MSRPGSKRVWGTGVWAERFCALWLQLHGWSVLERRLLGHRGSGVGEVDLVVRRRSTVAFVEIKYRRTKAQAAQAISTNQKRRLVRAAKAYISAHPSLSNLTVRFDVLLVSPWSLPDHIVNAWDEEA
jgi:putative endonuclease